MDKLYNNPWFVKITSFFIAVMLFAVVNYDNVNNQPGVLPTITNASKTLEEVPLHVHYDEDQYAITEIPENVTVHLRGPQNFLNILQIRPTYEVYIDLRDLGPGSHNVTVEHRNFPNELNVNIVPQTVRVTIEEKRTISLPVEIDLINKNAINEGYSVGEPVVNPINVEITAAESILNHVAFAKGFVDLEGVKRTVETSVPVKVYDQQGNELHLDVNPTVVDVKIPITSPNKDVPLKVNRLGELPEGLSIRSITTDPKEVTIYAPKDILNEISYIDGLNIDLSTITENTIFEVEIPVPEGVEEVSPSTVDVVVEVDLEEQLEVDNLVIEVIGLTEQMEVSFVEPEEGFVTLTAKGSPNSIDQLQKEDIVVYIDVSQLSVGEHEVPLQISGPQNVTFGNEETNVTIIVSEVLNASGEDESSESEELDDETTTN